MGIVKKPKVNIYPSLQPSSLKGERVSMPPASLIMIHLSFINLV
jgi:hypothetical protein